MVGAVAVLAEFTASAPHLRLARSTALVAAVAQLIPERPMGSGTTVSVPAEVLPDRQGLTGAARYDRHVAEFVVTYDDTPRR